MKTPVTYYGGKQNLLRYILPLIPGDHRTYAEPFCGGAAVFFGKTPSKVEVLNDNLEICANFYRVCQTAFPKLQRAIRATLHSEMDYCRAREILRDPPHLHDPVSRAWAFWVATQMAFAQILNGGFAFSRKGEAGRSANKIEAFTEEICNRLRRVQIFDRDALEVIRMVDGEDTFFYLDPPYFNSDCGHYNRGKEVFHDLLALLPELRGRWLLSSYPCDEVETLWSRPGIFHRVIEQTVGAGAKGGSRKPKQECLTWNYQASQ